MIDARPTFDDLQTVCDWIAEAHGDKATRDWLWSCTPYPFGVANADQLADGMRLALGDITIGALMQDAEESMMCAFLDLDAVAEMEGSDAR